MPVAAVASLRRSAGIRLGLKVELTGAELGVEADFADHRRPSDCPSARGPAGDGMACDDPATGAGSEV